MDVTAIPFNAFLGISRSGDNEYALEMKLSDNMTNHLNTFHASAQFALAEACSGDFLLKRFPDLQDSVVPVLRKSSVKFRKSAQSSISTKADISAEELERFEAQFSRKGRATITVSVEVHDAGGTVTMTGTYEWFVQKIDK